MLISAGKKSIKIVVPGNAVGQARPRFNAKQGRTYEPKGSTEEKAYIRMLAAQEVEKRRWKPCPPEMPVEVQITSYRDIPSSKPAWYRDAARFGFVAPLKKPDADNVQKLVYDALNGIIYTDDKQIFSVKYVAKYSEQPRLEVVFTGYFVDYGEVKDAVKSKKSVVVVPEGEEEE